MDSKIIVTLDEFFSTMKAMTHVSRRLPYILATFVTTAIFAWYVNSVPPENPWSIVLFFLFALMITVLGAIALTKSYRVAIFLGIYSSTFLLFRFFGLRNIIYPILLGIFLIAVSTMKMEKK